MSKIAEILQGTQFENLIEKFELSSPNIMDVLMKKSAQGDLLNYLREFESDESRQLELASILQSGIKAHSTSVTKKGIMGLIVGLVLGSIFFFFLLGGLESSDSDDPTPLAECETIAEAKVRVDWLINAWIKEYNDLCNGPRNGTTKQAFGELMESVQSIEEAGEKCILLDYKDQLVVVDYARKKVESHQALFRLSTVGEIDCW
jgi:hypothetical protein